VNTILEKSNKMQFFTNLQPVFEAFGGRQRDFNWLISDMECNRYPDDRLPYDLERKPFLLSGEELTEIVNNNTIQFIWAVLSGFDKGIKIDINNLAVCPYADGNNGLWVPKPQIQHPLATVEIVCWDSSLTLLLSQDDDLTNRFRSYFTDAQDLNEYNKRL
jgi:hypothetical protein